jgi:hypothetical protein
VVFGKQNLLSERFYHFTNNIENLLLSFESKFGSFKDNVNVWKTWTQVKYTQEQFKSFVDTREYLSDKMKEFVTGYYEPVMNKYRMDETKWGAFNVLTYISTHETKARKGSNVFSNRYRTINKMEREFYTDAEVQRIA